MAAFSSRGSICNWKGCEVPVQCRLSVSILLSLCMCEVCVYVFVCSCANVSASMGRSDVDIECLLSSCLSFILFWDGIGHWGWIWPILLTWLASELPSCLSLSCQCWDYKHTPHPLFCFGLFPHVGSGDRVQVPLLEVPVWMSSCPSCTISRIQLEFAFRVLHHLDKWLYLFIYLCGVNSSPFVFLGASLIFSYPWNIVIWI